MEDLDDFYENFMKNDNFVKRLQKRYIRDAEKPPEYFSDEEFRKRFRFKKVTMWDILLDNSAGLGKTNYARTSNSSYDAVTNCAKILCH